MSSEAKENIVWAPCERCKVKTKHKIIKEHHEYGNEDYQYAIEYSIIRCMGCDTSSFRYVYSDHEAAYPTEDGDWDVPQTILHYPKILLNHKNIDGLQHVPDVVREIYMETLTAIKEDASILAGLGLRGTIEAICNERQIKGRSLEVRITKLAQQGLISIKDAERLHAIRFLGNDAAHEIKKPNNRQLSIALRIVEHMIVTVYVLDEEARKSLDTVITEYGQFVSLLEKRIKSFKSGDEYPLAKYLEKDVRRIQGGLSNMEANLISEISSGSYTKLKVGKVDTYMGSQQKLQHFIV